MKERLAGHLENSAGSIALALNLGAEAEIVGEKILTGLSIKYLEIDGVPIAIPPPRTQEQAGVRVVYPDGYTALYLMTNIVRAENLLARARELAD